MILFFFGDEFILIAQLIKSNFVFDSPPTPRHSSTVPFDATRGAFRWDDPEEVLLLLLLY